MLLYFSQILAVFIVGGYALTCDPHEYPLEDFCCPKCPLGKIQHKFQVYKVLLSPQLGGSSFSASHVVIGGDGTMCCTVASCGR